MATIADQDYLPRASAKAPISAHPAFPAIVALWFAALVGIGSMVLPVPLLEAFVTATGIAAAMPSLSPPLDFAGRATIGIGGALTGAILGLLLARQVAKAHMPKPRVSKSATERQCRPLFAHDELGPESVAAEAAAPFSPTSRRRSLAMAEQAGPSRYLQSAPLPGEAHCEQPDVDDTPDEPPYRETEEASGTDRQSESETDDALELGAFSHEEPESAAPTGLEALRQRVQPSADTQPMQDQPMTDSAYRELPSEFGDRETRQEFRPLQSSEAWDDSSPEAPAVPEAEAFEPGPEPDALQFAPPSLRRNGAGVTTEATEAGPRANAQADAWPEAAPRLSIVERRTEPAAEGMAADDDRPLDELGLVQLAARLGTSLERRRALQARRQASAPAFSEVMPAIGADEEFEAAGAEDTARAIADFFGSPIDPQAEAAPAEAAEAPPVPAWREDDPAPVEGPTPRPWMGLSLDSEEDEDEEALAASLTLPLHKKPIVESAHDLPEIDQDEDEDALAASLTLPLRKKPALEPAHDLPETDQDEDETALDDEGEYSSLLAMKNPFSRQQEFVRIEEPEDSEDDIQPTVTFPSAVHAPAPETSDDSVASAARPFDPPHKSADNAAPPARSGQPRDPGDAERDLRAALATLQRMSGAA